MVIKELSKFKALIVIVMFFAVIFALPSVKTYAAPGWYAENAYAYDTKGNIAIPSSASKGGTAATRFATVGYRITFGSYNQYYVDLAKNKYYTMYGGLQTPEITVAASRQGVTEIAYAEEGNTAFSLFLVDYSTFLRAVVGKYGAGSDAYNYISAPTSGTRTVRLYLDPIMTSAHISDYGQSVWLASGQAHVDSRYQIAWDTGNYYGTRDGMLYYWGTLTGNYSNQDIYYSYGKYVDIYIDSGTQKYTQTTYHQKKSAQTGKYLSAFKTVKEDIQYGARYTPAYTTVPTGYVKGGITAAYDVTGAHTNYAYYNPISYTVNYQPNGATGGSMNYSTYWYDWSQPLSKNQYERKYTVNFDGSLGEVETDSLTAVYDFNGWNLRTDGKGQSFTDGQNILNLTSTNNAKIDMYAQWTPNGITLPKAAREGGYEFLGWSTSNEKTVIYDKETEELPTLKEGDYYIPTKNETLYAVYYAIPPTVWAPEKELDYGDEMTEYWLLYDSTAEDATGKDISEDVFISDLGGLQLNIYNPYKYYDVEYCAVAPNGAKGYYTAKIRVTYRYVRYISAEYIDTLEPDSKWLTDPKLYAELVDCLNTERDPVQIWEFSNEDRLNIQRYMTTHAPSREAIDWFLENYSDRKVYEDLGQAYFNGVKGSELGY